MSDEAADLAKALAEPRAHPFDASAAEGVAWVQTHISHVFLTRERVYKLRKPVTPGFLDFGSLAARNADCVREVALNRRLAPDVYLGLAPVEGRGASARVGALREDLVPGCEHVVVMRRLRDGCDALSLLGRGALGPAHLDAVAQRIARFHAEHGLGAPAPFAAAAWQDRIAHPIRENVDLLEDAVHAGLLPASDVEVLRADSEAGLARLAPVFEARRVAGRAVDGHGDLHLQHVWFEGGDADPILIDCLEFSDELRQIDAASEVAFLAMDLRYRGARALAERFVRRWAALRDDYDAYAVLDFFAAYRAAVRAKVASLAAQEEELPARQREAAAESARRHLALARELLAPRSVASLVAVCGTVGTGKSTAAHALAEACGGVVIASDRVRKALAGLPDTARGAALYAPAQIEAVYGALLERAAPVLRSGRVAILDATYARRAERDRARAFASAEGAEAWLLEVDCAPEVARARVAARARRGDDPSDAGPERVDESRRTFEPPEEWPPGRRIRIETDAAGWEEALGGAARRLAS
jgi:hypothetical protein